MSLSGAQFKDDVWKRAIDTDNIDSMKLDNYHKIVELAPDKVFALQNSLPLDGNVSAYPKKARGFSVSNCYILKEAERAFILDTGFAAHESRILEQIEEILGQDVPVSLFPMRINEFMSVGNAMAINKKFNVTECYSPQPDVTYWLEFETVDPRQRIEEIPTILLRGPQDYFVDEGKQRMISAFSAPLRLINTTWIFDHNTNILFTSDMFTHNWCEQADSDWIIEGEAGKTSVEFVRSFLLNTRYWWLEGAITDKLREGIADVISRYDIETIAPAYGSIIRGREFVRHQFEILDKTLGELDRRKTKPAYIPRGAEK